MRKLFAFIGLATIICNSNAQITDCSGSRYYDSTFAVTVTPDVKYGENNAYNGALTELFMDIYEPTGDTATVRPIIIFAPKGSFLSMDRKETTMVELCTRFAARGYVTAAIDYRTGVDYMAVLTNAELEFTKAVLRAAHDYKAAIRFFRKDAYTTNTYKIDTNIVIAGGSSAGAITALHVAYLDKYSEIPVGFDTTGLGGIEGNSGNPGYSSEPHIVVNLCGAIADSVWIEPGDMPLVSMHGNLDTEVPYGTATISLIIPIMEVDGSASIYQRTQHIGVEHSFYTFWGRTHIPYDENAGGSFPLYMDTVVDYVRNFLYNQLCGATSIKEVNYESVVMYPNPATSMVNIGLPDSKSTIEVTILDIRGNKLFGRKYKGEQNAIVDVSKLAVGVYFVTITSDQGKTTRKLVRE
ncbi:MAG: T9SS type A sorting domain-containing protein [Bacteroidetes bacterium]|nr:T9SS type A sorting domain-containing protein [Bacteroidota bacterium]MBU1718599.1 T9SS type A sorting domain-containing protein [Bacteroidota bacterium]